MSYLEIVASGTHSRSGGAGPLERRIPRWPGVMSMAGIVIPRPSARIGTGSGGQRGEPRDGVRVSLASAAVYRQRGLGLRIVKVRGQTPLWLPSRNHTP